MTALLGVAPARADVLKDLLGVNPFKSSNSGSSGVVVSDEEDAFDCPGVGVFEGGSSVRHGGSPGAGATGWQMTIGEVARECMRAPDGRAIVNVGVDVRAMLGQNGRPGTYSAPVTILMRSGSTVLSSVTRQVTITIPAGEANAIGTVIERGILVPAGDDLVIEVGFGGSAAKGRKRGR